MAHRPQAQEPGHQGRQADRLQRRHGRQRAGRREGDARDDLSAVAQDVVGQRAGKPVLDVQHPPGELLRLPADGDHRDRDGDLRGLRASERGHEEREAREHSDQGPRWISAMVVM